MISPAATPEPPWPSLAIVIPVYNEAQGIEHACSEIASVAGEYPGRAAVIAVDDGSSDDSAVVLARLEQTLPLLFVCRHTRNAGYGAALKTGADRAAELGFEYVAFIDSDLTNPPSDLLKIGDLARQGHQYIKASRFIEGGRMTAVPIGRRVVSASGNFIGRILFGTRVRDVTNGFRAVRTDLFRSWELQERGFPVIVEELDHALREGIEPAQFPSILTVRQGEQRPSAFPYNARTIWSYLRYPLRAFFRRVVRAQGGTR